MEAKVRFDFKKSTQGVNYFLRKESNFRLNKMKILKLVWIADRYHLRKYGRPIFGDKYFAMKLGPVASAVKDIVEDSSFFDETEQKYIKDNFSIIDKNTVESKHVVDFDSFSDTDLEAMDFSYKTFGHLTQFQLSKVTHNYPEWRKFKAGFDSGILSREEINYFDFFKNPENIKNDPFELSPEILSNSLEVFKEELKYHKLLWGGTTFSTNRSVTYLIINLIL